MTTERGAAGNLEPAPGDAVDSEMGAPQTISASYGTGLSSTGSAGSGSMSGGSGDKLKDTAGRVADRVSDTIGEEVDNRAGAGFDRAGMMLEHVANAVERAGDELRPEEAPVADIARAAAGQIRSAAGYVRSADVGTIIGNAEDFARRQPAIFLGGALAIGLMASRFLKASPTQSSGYGSPSDTPGRFSSGMSSGYRAYGGYRSPAGSTASGTSTLGSGLNASTSTGSASTSGSLSTPSGREGIDDRV